MLCSTWPTREIDWTNPRLLRHSSAMRSLDEQSIETFNREGFLVIENVLDDDQIDSARERFPKLFRGEFETGLQPDEWNWRDGRDAEALTRQICNGWKSDRTIAALVLAEWVGDMCARLRDWPGARINQDNVLWKPAGGRPLGFHQDDSYQSWIRPNEMMTCWMTLDDTRAGHGTIEYVPGSHRWPLAAPVATFHAPEDPLADMMAAAATVGASPTIVPIEVPAGSIVLHHGRIWHGSRDNHGDLPRRSVVAHCMSSEATFDERGHSPIYNRYKLAGTDRMDESFFPILWTRSGYRTAWLDSYCMQQDPN